MKELTTRIVNFEMYGNRSCVVCGYVSYPGNVVYISMIKPTIESYKQSSINLDTITTWLGLFSFTNPSHVEYIATEPEEPLGVATNKAAWGAICKNKMNNFSYHDNTVNPVTKCE